MWKAVFRKNGVRIEETLRADSSEEAVHKAENLSAERGWKLICVEEIIAK